MGERVFSRSPVRAEWPLIKKKLCCSVLVTVQPRVDGYQTRLKATFSSARKESIAFLPNEQHLALWHYDGMLQVWNVPNGSLLRT